MKMEVPQVDLPLEVLAWTKVTEDILNIYKQSLPVTGVHFRSLYGRYYESLHQPAGI